MLIYGFTRVILNAGSGTRKTYTRMFPSKKRRDHGMYADYRQAFIELVGEGEKDSRGDAMLSEAEFQAALDKSSDPSANIFGVFVSMEGTVQYEPFSGVV